MQRYTVYFIWKLLYVFRSADNYLQHLVFVTPVLLTAAVVEELELIRVCWHIQTSSNSSTMAAGSSNDVTNTSCCRYSCLRS
jgi:hypothetical protein